VFPTEKIPRSSIQNNTRLITVSLLERENSHTPPPTNIDSKIVVYPHSRVRSRFKIKKCITQKEIDTRWHHSTTSQWTNKKVTTINHCLKTYFQSMSSHTKKFNSDLESYFSVSLERHTLTQTNKSIQSVFSFHLTNFKCSYCRKGIWHASKLYCVNSVTEHFLKELNKSNSRNWKLTRPKSVSKLSFRNVCCFSIFRYLFSILNDKYSKIPHTHKND